MNSNIQRYFYIEYDDLKLVKFKKLEKVCDKIFVLINEDIEQVPFKLVKQIQHLGKNALWIPFKNKSENSVWLNMSFLMGQMHEKENKEVEFAILSNNEDYDSLVELINFEDRSCIRVKTKKKKTGKKKQSFAQSSKDKDNKDIFDAQAPITKHGNSKVDHKRISHAAKNTIKRLIDSGNRPSELALLKSYILLNNKGEGIKEYLGKIIDHLAALNEIEINKEEVIYNF